MAELTRLYPARDHYVAGVPAVVMDVKPSEAKRLLKYTPPAFTDAKPDNDRHLEQFRDEGGHFMAEDFSGRIAEMLGPDSAAVDPIVFAPEPSPSPGSSGTTRRGIDLPDPATNAQS